MTRRQLLERIFVAAILVSIPLLVFYKSLFTGEAFVPGDLLSYVAPWSHTVSSSPQYPWNVLRFDGITQFYPWRLEAARSVHAGRIPLWNSYAFAASGGTPFLADSQSAPLYPINAVFYLFSQRTIWYAFGLVAALQLEIAAAGTYVFLRRCVFVGRAPALFGALTFALSGPVTTWLSLPTFLSVSCWIPWLLVMVYAAHGSAERPQVVRRILGVGVVAGLMILAGHLQIALYGLLLAFCYSLFLRFTGRKTSGAVRKLPMYLAAVSGASAIAVSLALPQLLPAIELSRISHRAANGFPTWDGYRSFIANALPVRNLVTLLVPNFFGHPNSHTALYWNTNNYAEWALYAGVSPLILCCFGIGLPWRKAAIEPAGAMLLRTRGFFCTIALASLLLATGTPANVPLFFLLPGYSQIGNPGRILVIFVFAVAVLAAVGLEAWRRAGTTGKSEYDRALVVALSAPALLAAVGAGQAAAFQRLYLQSSSLGALLKPVLTSIYTSVLLFFITGLLLLLGSRRVSGKAVIAIVGLAFADLAVWGWGYNPTIAPNEIYPLTPGISFLQKNTGAGDLVAPINRRWSIGSEGPRGAVLPPNTLTVFGLHDIAGYDSLFRRVSKDQIRDAGDGVDPSPPENGNMLFVKDAETAVRLGAHFIVFAPDNQPESVPPSIRLVYVGEDLVIYENTTGLAAFDSSAVSVYRPASFRIGLFMALLALAGVFAIIAAWQLGTRTRLQPQPGVL